MERMAICLTILTPDKRNANRLVGLDSIGELDRDARVKGYRAEFPAGPDALWPGEAAPVYRMQPQYPEMPARPRRGPPSTRPIYSADPYRARSLKARDLAGSAGLSSRSVRRLFPKRIAPRLGEEATAWISKALPENVARLRALAGRSFETRST